MEIRTAASDDLDSIARIYGNCFPALNRTYDEWLAELQPNPLRTTADFLVAEEKRQITGAMLIIPHRTYIGGEEFRSGGIAGVAVPQEFRNRGIAGKMIRFALVSMERHGTALSMLFPSKKSYYDAFGFALVGEAHFYSVPPAALPDEQYTGEIAPVTVADCNPIVSLYQRYAKQHTLMLARSGDVWSFLLRSHARSGRKIFSYAANNKIEGYCIVSPGEETEIRELIAESPDALRALLQFVKTEFRSSKRILFRQPKDFPVHLICDDAPLYGTENYFGFFPQSGFIGLGYMARILDAEKILSERNYGTGELTASISITDPIIPKNSKTFTIRISGSSHRITVNDRQPDMVLGIRHFTQIATGYLSFSSANKLGFLKTSVDTKRLDELFAIPSPHCLDFF